jgi:hypothetical protein
MVASTLHELPLITGFGPVFPLHWPLVARAIDRLPAPAALQELVDLTGLRWVLLRPSDEWPNPGLREEIERAIDVAGSLHLDVGGFRLQRIDLPERHPEWARAIGRGYRRGESLLGTAYASLPAGTLAAAIAAPPRADALAGELVEVPIAIANRGEAVWPGALSGNGGAPDEIFVAARWRPAHGAAATLEMRAAGMRAGLDSGLRRDLPAGESLDQVLVLPAPAIAGDYELELRLAQRGDAAGPGPAARAPDVVVPISVRSR